MKTCSKCHKAQPETQFVKSNRYKSGLFPICKDCRNATRRVWLEKYPLCSKCGVETHAKNHPYCTRCNRIACGRPAERTRKQAKEPHLCPQCNERPKETSRGYCRRCFNRKRKEWIKKQGGQWAYHTKKGQRQQLVARAYVNHLIQRGQLQRQPCEVCGKLESEAHHNSYENYLDIRWLCTEHHDALHRWLVKHRKRIVVDSSNPKA